jgi:hypothetical protein
MNYELLLGAIGTILSVYLGIREILKNRPRFYTTFFFTGNPEENDAVVIYNGSAKTVVISHYNLFQGMSLDDPSAKDIDLGNAGEFLLMSIAPDSIFKIHIPDQYKFRIKQNNKLYLSIEVMGHKKPFKLKVC